LTEQQLPKVDPKQVCFEVAPQLASVDTGSAEAAVELEDDVEEPVEEAEDDFDEPVEEVEDDLEEPVEEAEDDLEELVEEVDAGVVEEELVVEEDVSLVEEDDLEELAGGGRKFGQGRR
jgi:vacuolar-type H+-ATPase subunit H